MQLTALFRRGIVVPLDDRTDEQFARWSIDGMVMVGFVAIRDDSLFNEIWDAGIFHAINEACSTIIDNYEEEIHMPDFLDAGLAALVAKHGEVKQSAVRSFVEEVVALLRIAQERGRPVYFLL